MFHYKIPLWVQKGHGWLLVNPHSLTDHNPWKQTSAAYIWLRKFLCTTGQPKMLFLWGYLSINNFARKLTDTKCYKGADGADINHWHCTSVFWNQETLPSYSGRSAVIPATQDCGRAGSFSTEPWGLAENEGCGGKVQNLVIFLLI